MSGSEQTPSEKNRMDFAALAAQLAKCTEVAGVIVQKVKQNDDVPAALTTELLALQMGLLLHLQAAEQALKQWPSPAPGEAPRGGEQ